MGGVHGEGGGTCVAGGHVWIGVHGSWGVHAMHACPPPSRHHGYGIRSMSGRYTSYWNAFLLKTKSEDVFSSYLI